MKPALMQMFRYKSWQIGEISSKWRRLILELLAIICPFSNGSQINSKQRFWWCCWINFRCLEFSHDLFPILKNIYIYSCTLYLPAMWNRMEIGSDWRSSDFRWVLLDSLNFRLQPVSPHRQTCMAMSYQFLLDNFSNTHETVFYMFRCIDLSPDRFSHCNTNRLYLCPNHF